MSMSTISMSSSSSPAFPPDHLPASDQLCYVNCNFCHTVLAVGVPSSSLFKTVTVRCGHCSNLFSLNMRALLLPASLFPPQNLWEEIQNGPSNMNMLLNSPMMGNPSDSVRGFDHLEMPKTPPVNRPPEKRQRVPSAYNRFIKDEIQRIKAGNPDISHREAFSAAAKNWAHFPHIHFGLMPDHHPPVNKANLRPQEGEEVLMKEGFYSPAANIGVSPY